MEAGLRGNRAPLLQQFISQGDHTLRPGFEYWITGAANLWIPATSPSDSKIVINNATTNALTITANGGTPIFGVARSTGGALSGSDRVRILPGQQASFVMGDRGWIAHGCEQNLLTFSYNGNPLSNNPANPLGAGGIFHYLGIPAGGGTWANPAGTSLVTAAISSLDSGSAGVNSMTNRVASGENVISGNAAGSWMGWYFPGRQLRVNSFIFQTRSPSNNHPRNFQIRVGTLSSLSSGTDVTSIPVAQSWADRSEVTTSNTYYGPYTITTPLIGNTVIWQSTGVDSGGASFHGAQEIELFGDYLL